MNLNPVGDFLAPFYSHTGRPAIRQLQILRSFVLMFDRKFTSLTNWVDALKSDDFLAMLIGCSLLTILLFPSMAPASIHMPALTGIKFAAVLKAAFPAVPVRTIFLTRMHPGDRTVTLTFTITDILSICSHAIMIRIRPIFRFISVSLMPGGMTVFPVSSHSLNSGG